MLVGFGLIAGTLVLFITDLISSDITNIGRVLAWQCEHQSTGEAYAMLQQMGRNFDLRTVRATTDQYT